MRIDFEELAVFFCVLEFMVERSKVILRMCYVGGRPLAHECKSNPFILQWWSAAIENGRTGLTSEEQGVRLHQRFPGRGRGHNFFLLLFFSSRHEELTAPISLFSPIFPYFPLTKILTSPIFPLPFSSPPPLPFLSLTFLPSPLPPPLLS